MLLIVYSRFFKGRANFHESTTIQETFTLEMHCLKGEDMEKFMLILLHKYLTWVVLKQTNIIKIVRFHYLKPSYFNDALILVILMINTQVCMHIY